MSDWYFNCCIGSGSALRCRLPQLRSVSDHFIRVCMNTQSSLIEKHKKHKYSRTPDLLYGAGQCRKSKSERGSSESKPRTFHSEIITNYNIHSRNDHTRFVERWLAKIRQINQSQIICQNSQHTSSFSFWSITSFCLSESWSYIIIKLKQPAISLFIIVAIDCTWRIMQGCYLSVCYSRLMFV